MPALAPLRQEVPAGVEHLDAVVFAVDDVDVAGGVERDPGRRVEPPGEVPRAPHSPSAAPAGERLDDPVVACVGDVDFTGVIHGEGLGTVEFAGSRSRRRRCPRRRPSWRARRRGDAGALGRIYEHSVVVGVGDVDVAGGGSDGDGVGSGEGGAADGGWSAEFGEEAPFAPQPRDPLPGGFGDVDRPPGIDADAGGF